jgi:hypothetical protein
MLARVRLLSVTVPLTTTNPLYAAAPSRVTTPVSPWIVTAPFVLISAMLPVSVSASPLGGLMQIVIDDTLVSRFAVAIASFNSLVDDTIVGCDELRSWARGE